METITYLRLTVRRRKRTKRKKTMTRQRSLHFRWSSSQDRELLYTIIVGFNWKNNFLLCSSVVQVLTVLGSNLQDFLFSSATTDTLFSCSLSYKVLLCFLFANKLNHCCFWYYKIIFNSTSGFFVFLAGNWEVCLCSSGFAQVYH